MFINFLQHILNLIRNLIVGSIVWSLCVNLKSFISIEVLIQNTNHRSIHRRDLIDIINTIVFQRTLYLVMKKHIVSCSFCKQFTNILKTLSRKVFCPSIAPHWRIFNYCRYFDTEPLRRSGTGNLIRERFVRMTEVTPILSL